MSVPVHKQRRGTAAAMAAANELPAPGQIYFELDTNRVKIGDGSRRYNDLPYLDLKSIAQLPGLQEALDSKVASTDPRLTDARTPTAHAHDDLYYRESEVDSLLAGKVSQDDFRLTDSRTPTSHAASHAAGQADEITPAAIGAAPTSHTHDDRYYTETEVDGKIAASEAWSIDTFLPYTGLSAVLSNGYYSKTETDTLLAGKQATGNYIVEGDARLTNARTPTAHVHSASDVTSGTFTIGRIPLGTTSSTVCVGNDARLSDQRTPLDNSVTAAKIAALAVTAGKIANDAVTSNQIANDSVGRLKLNAIVRDKLDGIQDGATANATNAQLRDRTTHTGEQAISTVTGLQAALDGKQATGNYSLVGHTHPLSSLEQSSATTGQVVTWNGTAWAAATPASGGGSFTGGTLTSQLLITSGAFNSPSIAFSADTTTGLFRAGIGALGISTNGVERLRIGADGEVGIGMAGASTIGLRILHDTDANNIVGSVLNVQMNASALTSYGYWTAPTLLAQNTAYATHIHYIANPISSIPSGSSAGTEVGFQFGNSIQQHTVRAFVSALNALTGFERYAFLASGSAPSLFNGSVWFANGAVGTPSIAFSSDNNTGFFQAGASPDTISVAVGGSEAAQFTGTRINVNRDMLLAGSTNTISGNAGIIFASGTNHFRLAGNTTSQFTIARVSTLSTTPDEDACLQIVSLAAGDTRAVVRVGAYNDVTRPQYSFMADTDSGLANPSADVITVVTGQTERMRIDAGGRVGIATNNPQNTLHVNGTVRATNLTDGTTTKSVTAVLAAVASNTTQAGGGTAINNAVVITQAAYNALATKDPNTLYFVT